jgi:hypothetical protein
MVGGYRGRHVEGWVGTEVIVGDVRSGSECGTINGSRLFFALVLSCMMQKFNMMAWRSPVFDTELGYGCR